jgi:hypothetical protein
MDWAPPQSGPLSSSFSCSESAQALAYVYFEEEPGPCGCEAPDQGRGAADGGKFCQAARLSYQQRYLKVVEGWRLKRRKMVEVQKSARPPFGIT